VIPFIKNNFIFDKWYKEVMKSMGNDIADTKSLPLPDAALGDKGSLPSRSKAYSICSQTIVVGARSSPLSQEQVLEVWNELCVFHPNLQFQPLWIATCGDTDRTTPLWKVSKTDFFTQEIDEKLVKGECRIAIHSAKDLPTPLPAGLSIIALTKGLNPKDALVMRSQMTLDSLPLHARIGTSSKRREAAIKKLRSDLQPIEIRGTIGERLEMVHKGAIDGVIVAEAALIRLKKLEENRVPLDYETEPLQGRLAVIARNSDTEMASLFAPIDARERVAVVGPSIPRRLQQDHTLKLTHSPLIRLQPLPVKPEDLHPLFLPSDLILTSKHAALFLSEALREAQLSQIPSTIFCVGDETAAVAHSLFPNNQILIPEIATQEGLVSLIFDHRPSRLFWPHSTYARMHLPSAIRQARIDLIELPLYTPRPCPPSCSFEAIDTAFFTCPSSVDVFFDTVDQKMWEHLSMQAIGPITLHRLEERQSLKR
jgi:hydroxymethylbilane synthase